MTLDFVNGFQKMLDEIRVFYGDVVYRPGEIDVVTRHVDEQLLQLLQAQVAPHAGGGRQRRIVERLLLQQVELIDLEAEPMSTPARGSRVGEHLLEDHPREHVRLTTGATCARETLPQLETDLLVLKLIKKRTLVGEDFEVLRRVVTRADSRSPQSLEALVRHGAVDAMTNVIKVGDVEDRSAALRVLERLQHLDNVTELVVAALALLAENGVAATPALAAVEVAEAARSSGDVPQVCAALEAMKELGHPSSHFTSEARRALERLKAMTASGGPGFKQALVSLGLVETMLAILSGSRNCQLALSLINDLGQIERDCELVVSAAVYAKSMSGCRTPAQTAVNVLRTLRRSGEVHKMCDTLTRLHQVGLPSAALDPPRSAALASARDVATSATLSFREALGHVGVLKPLQSLLDVGSDADKAEARRLMQLISEVSTAAAIVSNFCERLQKIRRLG